MLNSLYQSPNDLPYYLSVTDIYNPIQHINHIITSTTGIPKTNKSNIHIFHCQALYKWFYQLYVRMGEDVSVPPGEETEFSECFEEQLTDKDELQRKNLTFNLSWLHSTMKSTFTECAEPKRTRTLSLQEIRMVFRTLIERLMKHNRR